MFGVIIVLAPLFAPQLLPLVFITSNAPSSESPDIELEPNMSDHQKDIEEFGNNDEFWLFGYG